jgi:hypothetical protein
MYQLTQHNIPEGLNFHDVISSLYHDIAETFTYISLVFPILLLFKMLESVCKQGVGKLYTLQVRSARSQAS